MKLSLKSRIGSIVRGIFCRLIKSDMHCIVKEELAVIQEDRKKRQTSIDATVAQMDSRFTILEKNLRGVSLSCKQLGRLIAKENYGELIEQWDVPSKPGVLGFTSKACCYDDLRSPWFAFWTDQLKLAPILHRKLWEYAFICQTLHESGCLSEGKRALGFGCGEEELPALFASRGVEVTATDLDPNEVKGMGWAENGQHTTGKAALYFPEIVGEEEFEKNVVVEYADMNAISERYFNQYDFCWSVCALEHLGSIAKGIEFVVNSGKTLVRGGVMVHTTEFNIFDEEQTVDNQQTVLFRKKDFEEMASRLEELGFEVAPLDFTVGQQIVDQYVDIPPFPNQGARSSSDVMHLKLMLEGFASTCFGIVARKK